MKALHCADAGFDCPGVIRGETNEQVLEQAAIHAQQVHHVTVTPELAHQLEALIKEEPASVAEGQS